jgi:hypothetical protein
MLHVRLHDQGRISFDVPGIYLACTSHVPGRVRPPAPAAGREGSAGPQLEPGQRPAATHQSGAPAIFRVTPQMPEAAARPGPAVSDLDPDHAVCSPDRDHAPLPRSARAAVPDAVPGQLAYQQRGVIPAQVPRAEHPDRERAGDPRPLRPPAIVALSRTALAISAPVSAENLIHVMRPGGIR